MNLFIIGNGFDIAHGMKTKYTDFRDFLIQKYLYGNYTEKFIAEIPSSSLLPDGDIVYDKKDIVTAIIDILDATEGSNEWGKIEQSLSNLDYSIFLDNYSYLFKNNIFDEKCFRNNYYNNEDNATVLADTLSNIVNYFENWIKTIKLPNKPIQNLDKLINKEDDLFLTFNYTETLEKRYQIDPQNICHIHGKQNCKIEFGHYDNNNDFNYYQNLWLGAEEKLIYLKKILKKDVKKIYIRNKHFFDKISSNSQNKILNIYSFGFSYSEVDIFYIKKILESLDCKNISFYLNKYDYDLPETRRRIFNILEKFGYNGYFSYF